MKSKLVSSTQRQRNSKGFAIPEQFMTRQNTNGLTHLHIPAHLLVQVVHKLTMLEHNFESVRNGISRLIRAWTPRQSGHTLVRPDDVDAEMRVGSSIQLLES